MAETTPKQRFRAGPKWLIAVTAGVVAVGVGFIYAREGGHPSYLFFFFLPVAGVSVVLGRLVGLLTSLLTVLVTLLPAVWLGLDDLTATTETQGEATAILVAWAVFLVATAYLVGWVSERGGSLSFAQGLGGQAIRAIELERRRTGQDIHDGLAQYAAAAFVETEVLGELTARADPQTRAQVQRVKHSLDMLVKEARAMIGNLRPPGLEPGEFETSLAALADALRARTGMACDLEVEGDFGLHTASARICVYRVVQEALANVEQHAGATAAQIWARAGKGGVDVIVRDNGTGFDLTDLSAIEGAHFGVSGMRERAEYLGGRLTIKSLPEEGTSVILHIPKYRGGGNGR